MNIYKIYNMTKLYVTYIYNSYGKGAACVYSTSTVAKGSMTVTVKVRQQWIYIIYGMASVKTRKGNKKLVIYTL